MVRMILRNGSKKEKTMKKTLNFIGIMALTMVMFSCTKEAGKLTEQINDSEKETSSEATEEEKKTDVTNLDPEKYLVGFGVSLEGVQTKAEVNLTSGALAFEDGDEALVVCGTETGTYVYASSSEMFAPKTVGDAIELSGKDATVYYPAAEFEYNAGTVTFTMPAAVTAGSADDLGDKLPLCGIVPMSDTPEADFKNLGSVLYVRFNSTAADGETITAVELSGSGVNITGSGEVTWSSKTPVLAALDGGTSLTIDCSAASKHLTSAAYQEFFFFLPQSGSFEDMTIKAYYGKSDGTVSYSPYEQISRSSAMTLSRGKLVKIQKTLSGFFGGGDGSADYPYLITNGDQFKALSTLGNNTTSGYSNVGKLYYDYNSTSSRNFFRSAGANYRQTTDIDFAKADLSDYMVGIAGNNSDAASFKGIYDGDNHKISNFSIFVDKDYVGLFANVAGVIKNLTLENISVTGKQATGGIIAWLNGTATNCHVTGTSSVTGTNGSAGIAASIRNASLVYGCTNYATISGSGNVGGVVGYMANAGKVERCNNNGTVIGSSRRVGGILGACNASGGKVLGCQNFGNVTNTYAGSGEYGNLNGGIVGDATNGMEINASSTPSPAVYSRNEGAVSGKNGTGGIIGQLNGGSIACTTNAGPVNGTYDVGGIIGIKANGGIWSLVFNQGTVTGTYNVGGLVGRQENGSLCGNVLSASTNYVRNEAPVTATGKDGSNFTAAGGLIGRMNGGNLGDPSVKKTAENTGNVTATGSGDGVGGLVGYLVAGNVAHCRSNATITNSRKCVGGAIGWMAGGKVYNSYAKGIVKGLGQVGGFVGYIFATEDSYIINCAAGASRVVATNNAANDGVGGFVGYMNQASDTYADKKVVIANCVAWKGVIKAPNEDNTSSNTIRVGGFAGVLNYQTNGGGNTILQNCYYQGLPSTMGYGGGEDDDTLPTRGPAKGSANGMIGIFGGYLKGLVKDCYAPRTSDTKNDIFAGGNSYYTGSGNQSRLMEDIMYGRQKITWALSNVNGSESVAANTYYLDGLLDYVAEKVGNKYGGVALSTWANYTVGTDKYFYPSVLTELGEDFYKK